MVSKKEPKGPEPSRKGDAPSATTSVAEKTKAKAKDKKPGATKPIVVKAPAVDFGPTPKAPPKGAAVGEALDLVVGAYGKIRPLEAGNGIGDILDHAIYVILARGAVPKKVEEAVRRLHTEYVDWNEVRLTEGFELMEVFSDLIQVPDLFERCEKVKSLLSQIYQDQNKLSLEFLREKTGEERAKFLSRIQALTPEQMLYVLLAVEGFDKVTFHYSSARVVQRLAVVKRTGSPTQMVELMQGLLAKRDSLSDQMGLVWLGENICLSKNPLCRQCVLVRVCVSRKV